MRVAAIDCGTNSIRLLVADGTDGTGGTDGRLTDVVREMRVVRLGAGVDRTGSLGPKAIERTRNALVDYAATIASHGAERTRMVATSATRDAANRDVFVAMVHDVLGAEPEVITGDEEAALSFAGAMAGLRYLHGPVLVADIGGGSTELVVGSPDAPVDLRARSIEVGCVRMTERHLHSDPPTDAQIEAAVTDIRDAIERAGRKVPWDDVSVFVGVSGTVTTMAAIALGLRHYDPQAIHGSMLRTDQIHDVTARLLAMRHAERAALPVMHPGRVDVIGGGALVLRTLVEVTGASGVIVSEHDILDGIALSLLH